REGNAYADGLANEAMDARENVVQIDALGLLETAAGARSRPAPNRAAPAAHKSSPIPAARTPPTVRAHITADPTRGQCAAGMEKGRQFEFTATSPQGLCL